MLHIIFTFYILTFTLATSVSILAFLLAKKYKSNLYIYTGLIFLGALLNLLTYMICLYRHIAGNIQYSTTSWDYYLFIIISGFLMLYYMPLLIYKITDTPITKLKRTLHISILVIILSAVVIEYLYYMKIAEVIRNILYTIIFIYSAWLILAYHRKIQNQDARIVLISFSILVFSIIPLILVHRLFSLIFFPDSMLLNLPHFNTLLLLISAIIALSYGAKYLFNERIGTGLMSVGEVAKNTDVSQREQEIIRLLIRGLSNKQIAENLYISQKTVKNHIYHIYQKLGIKNRIQLINKFLDD